MLNDAVFANHCDGMSDFGDEVLKWYELERAMF